MREMGVEDVSKLTAEQIEEITERVSSEVPGSSEISRRNLEAFMTTKKVEKEGGSNREN